MTIHADFPTQRHPPSVEDRLRGWEGLASSISRLGGGIDEMGAMAPDAVRPRLAALKGRLAAFDPSISVIGQVKAGKTSVLNALIGMPDLLPSDVNPWTSVVTSVHVNHRAPGGHRAVFRFFDEADWDAIAGDGGRLGRMAGRRHAEDEAGTLREQIAALRARTAGRLGKNYELLLGQSHRFSGFDGDLLRRYVCLGDGADPKGDGRFSDLTRAADLYVDAPGFAVPATIRDTPGVNDPFLVREQMTLNALADSSVCVLVLSAYQALSSVDLGLLHLLRTMPAESVVLFVNRIDELSDPAREIPVIEESIRSVLDRRGLKGAVPILFGSARWASSGPGVAAALCEPAAAYVAGFGPEDAVTAASLHRASGIDSLREEIGARIAATTGADMLDAARAEMTDIAVQMRIHLDTLAAVSGRPASKATSLRAQTLRSEFHAKLARIESEVAGRLERDGRRAVARWTEEAMPQLPQLLRDGQGLIDTGGLRAELHFLYADISQDTFAAVQGLAREIEAGLRKSYAELLPDATCLFPIRAPALSPLGRPTALARSSSLDIRDGWMERLSLGWGREARLADRFRRTVEGEFAEILGELVAVSLHAGFLSAASVIDAFLEHHIDTLHALGSCGTARGSHRIVQSRAFDAGARIGAILDRAGALPAHPSLA